MRSLFSYIWRQVKARPWLYTRCVNVLNNPHVSPGVQCIKYVAQGGLKPSQLKIVLQRYPHLYLYARYVRLMTGGEIRKGLDNISQQIVLDYQNYTVLRKHRLALKAIYQEAILKCIEHRVNKWWTFLPNAKLDSVHVLQTFLRDCLLKRSGDYTAFLKLREDLMRISDPISPNEEFFDKMAEHFKVEIEEIDSGNITKELKLDKSMRSFVIGVSVWGQHYIKILLDYCLPSLLTEGNLGILCKERQLIILVHTDEEGKELLENSDSVQKVRAKGAMIIYKMVNPQLTKYFADNPDYKYWHLGMIQSLELYLAKTLDADYHILMPDSIYSNNHFAGLLRAVERGHKAILRLMLSTRMEGVCPKVEAYRKDGVISIPAADLTSLSLDNVHSASRAWIVTNNNIEKEMPNIYVLVWEGRDAAYTSSPHQTLLYLDREISRGIPKRYFITLDSELDKIIPENVPIYCPKIEDEICLIEMTSEKQRPRELKWSSLTDFCRSFWFGTQGSMKYWRIFDQENIDPINREMIPERGYMSETDIRKAKKTIQDALLQAYPATTKKQVSEALKIIESVKAHPEAHKISGQILEAKNSIKALSAEAVEKQSAA